MRFSGLLLLASALSCSAVAGAQTSPVVPAKKGCTGTLVYVGTQGSGPRQGIFAACLDPASGALADLGLAAEVARPTWLAVARRGDMLFAVSETGNDGKTDGAVYSLAVDRISGRLRPIGRADSGGGGATYVSHDARAETLFVANYGGGQVAAIPVGNDGTLSPPSAIMHNIGTGPTRRQLGPHAHSVVPDLSGHYVLSPDLGADKVFVYRFDPRHRTLAPAVIPATAFPPGSGPRHIVFSHDGRFAFVDTELSGEIYTLRWDARASRLAPQSRVALDAPEFAGTRSAAEIALSADGRFLYASNRAANQIQVFAVDAASGALTEVQRIDCGGRNPWSFGIAPSGRWLIVANQGSDELAVFAIDPRTGQLGATGNRLTVPKPVALAFVP